MHIFYFFAPNNCIAIFMNSLKSPVFLGSFIWGFHNSLQCQHPIWTSVPIPVAPLPIQLSGKATEDSPSVWALIHISNPNEAPCFWLQPFPFPMLQPFGMKDILSLSLFLFPPPFLPPFTICLDLKKKKQTHEHL